MAARVEREILALITLSSSGVSGESAQLLRLTRAFAARKHNG